MQPTPTDRRVERPNLTRLRWIGVIVPILAVILGEAFRYIIPSGPEDIVVHVFWASIAIIGIVLFALSMFWSISRSEHEVLRQNRELGAVNAVSQAVQDPGADHNVIVAALRSIVSTTYASRATVRIYPTDGGPAPKPISVEAEGCVPDGITSAPIELPMATGSAVVGLLQVWPTQASTDGEEGLSDAALQNISHQLGCAIQHRRLLDDLQRREREASALYDVALLVSAQRSLADILARITRSVRELLVVDEVALCLTPDASETVGAPASGAGAAPFASDGAICVVPGAGARTTHDHRDVCPIRADTTVRQTLEVPIRSAKATLGDIWIGRRNDRPFEAADHSLLSGLADLASIAITAAQLRERERLSATVAERERIARELHDSLAQVLGVTHLRLRAMAATDAVKREAALVREIADLADLTQEAFQDVREAILGLREASKLSRGFVESLAAYLDKFSRQAGLRVELDARVNGDPDLTPASEVQLIRVIQEALANVRKHAGADRAVIHLADDARATTIEIEDDGHGFDVRRAIDEATDAFGLETMRERMELVGGSLVVESSPGHGTRVVARIPREALGSSRPTSPLGRRTHPLRPQHGGTDAVEATASRATGR